MRSKNMFAGWWGAMTLDAATHIAIAATLVVAAGIACAADVIPQAATELPRMTMNDTVEAGYANPESATGTKLDMPVAAVLLTIDNVGRQATAVVGVPRRSTRAASRSMSSTVLKGAAGGHYGRIDPGGVINVVTRCPQAQRAEAVAATAGSYSTQRIEVDARGPVAGNERILYRGIAAYQSNRSFRDQVLNNYIVLVPALALLPSDRDRIDVRNLYQDFTDTTGYGVPVVPYQIDADGTLHEPSASSGAVAMPVSTRLHGLRC
jgi:hypothetical protein